MTNLKPHLLTLSLGLLILPTALRAETEENPQTDLVITALRAPVPHDEVSASVTVLDQAAIQQAQPIAITDVLQRTPGISLVRTGGYGSATSLTIRGAGSDQSVVVIDGMRVADPTAPAGNFAFSQLFADDIARIEILRGPQAILWGSDAIGGIINVTTVAPSKPLEGDFSLEAGSHNTIDAHTGVGGTSRLVDWRISGSAFATDGIPTIVGATMPNGYRRQAASATTTFHLASSVSLDLRGYWDAGRNSYSDGYSDPVYGGEYATSRQWTAYAGLNVALLDDRLKNRLAVLQDQTDNENYDPRTTPSLSFVGHGRIRRYEYQGSFTLSSQAQLVFGAEREEQRLVTGTPYDAIQPFDLTPHSASTDSAYAQVRVEPVTGLTLNGGVRYDHHSTYGSHTVFSAGAAYTPDGGVTLLRASWDEGYKAPSLYQLYSDYGSTALKPETAKGWEVTAERDLFGKGAHVAAAWFQRSTNNLIEYVGCPYGGTPPAICFVPGTTIARYGYYANIDKAQAKGLELTAAARLGQFYANGNYTYVSSQDRTPGAATYGQQLQRVPRHLANAEIGYAWGGGVTTSVAVRWSGTSTDFDYNAYVTRTLAAYAVVDLRAEWKLAPALTVFGRVENIGDKYYQTAYGYNSLGRTAYIGVRSHF